MYSGFILVGVLCAIALGFHLWFTWYTPRHKKK